MKENIEKVKEEKISLEFQISSLKNTEQKNALLQFQLEALKKEKEEWSRFLFENGKLIAADTPFAMAEALSKSTAEVSVLKETIESLKEYERSFHINQMKQLEKVVCFVLVNTSCYD